MTDDSWMWPSGGAAELFDGRKQLIVYHFMLEPESDHRCEGCAMFTDNVGHLAHIHARDTSLVLVSRARPSEYEPSRKEMGWTVPWFSSYGTTFNDDMGAGEGLRRECLPAPATTSTAPTSPRVAVWRCSAVTGVSWT